MIMPPLPHHTSLGFPTRNAHPQLSPDPWPTPQTPLRETARERSRRRLLPAAAALMLGLPFLMPVAAQAAKATESPGATSIGKAHLPPCNPAGGKAANGKMPRHGSAGTQSGDTPAAAPGDPNERPCASGDATPGASAPATPGSRGTQSGPQPASPPDAMPEGQETTPSPSHAPSPKPALPARGTGNTEPKKP